MTSRELPENVQQFIAECIDSVSLLDVLLLLRASPEKAWSIAQVTRALVSAEELVREQFVRLGTMSLAESDGDGLRYAPGRRAAVVDDLAACYARRRHAVIAAIYSSDRSSAHALADAFRIRRRKW